MNTVILSLIMTYANIYGVDPQLALAVAQVESGLDPSLVSPTEDYGVYQLHKATFREYTVEQLLNPQVNVPLGIKYLAEIRATSVHRQGFDWVIGFNLGPAKANRVHYPKKFPYYLKVTKAMVNNEVRYY